MKLVVILLTAAIVQVSASGFAQKITMNQRNASLKEVFSEVKRQTGYTVFYKSVSLKKAKPITINISNASIEEAMAQILAGQKLDFSINQNTIIIREKETPSFLDRVVDAVFDIRISGRVVDEKGNGLAGATVKVKGAGQTISAGGNGVFSIMISGNDAVLVVSYIGYQTKEVTVSGADVEMVIKMELVTSKLAEVAVVSTGYQTLPKERATGSFEIINKALLNRSNGQNVIPRLEGIVPGLLFDKRISGEARLADLTVRGMSTLGIANKSPLIVLDNFAYEGDVNNINPNDIESITILKDAAASSIWGVRAGNGVIVITTKKGAYDKPLEVSFNVNTTVTQKPDLFYLPVMTSSDVIGLEKMLFDQGVYDYTLTDTYYHSPVSLAVEIMDQQRSGTLSADQAQMKLGALHQIDARDDYSKYIYRKAANQQYALNLNGGTSTLNYIVSAGYDKGQANTVRTNNERLTLRTDLLFKPLKNLEISAGTIYTQGRANALGRFSTLTYNSNTMPYTQLADAAGNPMVVPRDYRATFAADPGDPRLLNWQYTPLAEMNASSNVNRTYDWLLNAGLKYKFTEVFSADVRYQSQRTVSENRNLEGQGSYFTRNRINLFTQAPGAALERPIPLGGILNQTHGNANTNTVRGQLNANKNWGSDHQLSAIAGVEVRQNKAADNSLNTYGYDENNLSYKSVDFLTSYPGYTWPFGGGIIDNGLRFTDFIYRFTSLYANAAYTFKQRYTVSASARKDASNLFGVKANQRGEPLWSAGAAWNVSNEPFYKVDLLPVLKLRTTYGYSGNTSNALSAYSVIQNRGAYPATNLPNAVIQNPANDNLRWERVGMANIGMDFAFKGNRLSGSIEYYRKKATDILFISPVALSTGFNFTTVNAVNMKGEGMDISLHSDNLGKASLKWNTDLIFSYNTGKITKYTPVSEVTSSLYTGASQSIVPIVGKPLYGVYSYKWAGLDPANGDPQGYDAEGTISKDYASFYETDVENLQFHGSAIPKYFGAFRNTLTWKKISVSANVVYKFGYYFRRSSIDYYNLFSTLTNATMTGHADFAARWQKPGDEKTTNVPSMLYPGDFYRESFYQGSSVLVEKGDHIRLQDITAGYSFDRKAGYFNSIRLYANLSNLGMLWQASKSGIDPDFGLGYPAARTFSIGLNASF